MQFIDKLGVNFMYAGLIHLALPKAKIIHALRSPMDNCYAAFKTLFPGVYRYSFDLKELANYYVGHAKMIEHWKSVMPGVIHTARYEDLVSNSRPAIEDLLDYCDLSFDENSLQTFLKAGETGKISGVRLHQEIRAQSVGHWKNYHEQMQPVAEIFDAAGIEWRPDHDSNMGPPD
ncbi:MAG: sulfotransferase family protein [Woeseiaceae bacterium]